MADATPKLLEIMAEADKEQATAAFAALQIVFVAIKPNSGRLVGLGARHGLQLARRVPTLAS